MASTSSKGKPATKPGQPLRPTRAPAAATPASAATSTNPASAPLNAPGAELAGESPKEATPAPSPSAPAPAATLEAKPAPAGRRRKRPAEEGPDVVQLSIATVGALLVGLLYLALPIEIVLGPRWLPLVLEVVLLAPPILALFTDRGFLPHRWSRALALALLVVMTVSLLGSIALLIVNLPQIPKGGELLRSGALIWTLNVLVFAVWYWETDGNGPKARHRAGYHAADFQFPQQADGDPGRWKPGFIDYLFLAFCTATALSPADTMPLTRRAKLLMMVQSVISLLALALIIGRSINII